MLSATIERTTQMSSMQDAVCGSNSLTSIPDCPYFLNSQREPSKLPVFVRSSFGFSNGSGLPFSSRNFGFGSKRSTCDGPPDIKRKMTRLAFGGNIGGFNANGLAVALSAPRTKSFASKPARPSIPKPLAKRPSICRRVSRSGVVLNCANPLFTRRETYCGSGTPPSDKFGGEPASKPLTPGVTGVEVVPELDVVLVLFPAEKYFTTADDGREINQTAIEILDLNFAFGEFMKRALEFGEELD